ncbi:MAG: hypothetical protein QX195_08690 [Methylococcaceae bacterium]|jgi:hypothetical protein
MKKIIPTKKALNPDELAQLALSQFNAGLYKEASDHYKNLLKIENKALWRTLLGLCYLNRAREMGAREMVKEAIIMWDNYAEQSAPPLQSFDHYLVWLLVSKNSAKLKANLSKLSATDLDESYPELAGVLGFLIITSQPHLESLLPQDAVFHVHLQIVRDALQAFRDNDVDKLEAALKELPFRSAFRDFRSLMKAVLLSSSDTSQAQESLLKISDNSPYQAVAQAILTYLSDGKVFVERIIQHNASQRKTLIQAKGLSKKHLDLLELVSKQKNLNAKLTFNLAIQYQALFEKDQVKQFCHDLLPTYNLGLKDYIRHFGESSQSDKYRLTALQAERERNFDEAYFCWERYINHLKNNVPDNAYKIALIQRHLAKHVSPKEALEFWIESLTHDPEDRESYFRILTHYETKKNKEGQAQYKYWLEKSLSQFPQNVEFLALAVKLAMCTKAYKKAAKYAKSLLIYDPVNTIAKQSLFECHLAHARRLLNTKKFHLVAQEIQAAEQISLPKRLQTQTQLLRGFYQYLSGDKEQGLLTIRQALNTDTSYTHFQVIVESLLLNLPATPFLKGLPALKGARLSASTMNQLLIMIKTYQDQQVSNTILNTALDKIKTVLRTSVQKQNFSEELTLSLCQTLESVGNFVLLSYVAKLAHAKWEKPIWVYYQIYANADGDVHKLGNMAVYQLEDSAYEAHQQNDHRTEMLINRLIDRYHKSMHSFPFNNFNFPFAQYEDEDEDEDEGDMLKNLFNHLPDAVMNKISCKIELIEQTNKSENIVLEVAKAIPQNIPLPKKMSMMINSDFITAFLILKAAKELNIAIGVTLADVIKYFETETKLPQSPF